MKKYLAIALTLGALICAAVPAFAQSAFTTGSQESTQGNSPAYNYPGR